MTIYYRKIYEQHFGPIPVDEEGRSYEIHHLDGNHCNNDPINLKAVSISDHYNIHYDQGDWGACLLIAARMKVSAHIKSDLARKAQVRLVEQGIHVWSGEKGSVHSKKVQQERIATGTHHFLGGEIARKTMSRRVTNGTHHWIGGELQREATLRRVTDGTHNSLKRPDGTSISSDRVNAGTHNWLGSSANNNRLRAGTHPSQVIWTCPHCGKTGKGTGNLVRHHGDNCKSRKSK